MKQTQQKRKLKISKIILILFLVFFSRQSFAEVTTTYANSLNSGTAFQYRSNYAGNDYIFTEQLNWVDGDIQGFAWKYYTLPETIINSSSVGHLKLKAIDPTLSYS